jgi:hypothetical protein
MEETHLEEKSADEENVKEHKSVRHLTEVVITPEHSKRIESKEFTKNKNRLKEDGHYRCWVCGAVENLEVHHFGCEWSLVNDCDFEKLKAFLEEWDPYGYGKLLKNKPITSVDDIRNLLVLCERHHIHKLDGIHETTFPVWIIQKICKEGVQPVPQDS